jgi:hypothetical protein
VILCVGKMEPFNAQDGNRVKADGVIVKPFEASDLVAMVKKLAYKAAPAPVTVPDDSQAMPFGQYKGVVWQPSSEEQAAEVELQPLKNVEVPQEWAAAPAMGLEDIPEESVRAEAASPVSEFEIEFEREKQPEPEPVSTGMTAAEGLSGVFEFRPATPVSEPEPQMAAPQPSPVPAGEEAGGFEGLPAAGPSAPAWDLPAEGVPGIEAPKTWGMPQTEPVRVAAPAAAEFDFDQAFAALRAVASAPAWVAEEVPLAPGEGEASLEAEMLHASAPASQPAAEPPAELNVPWSTPSATESPFAPPTAVAPVEPQASLHPPEYVAQPEFAAGPQVDPELIARVVERVIQRLKPELMAEVFRELHAELKQR